MATPEAVEFAALLKDLKDRSGRSYGVLAGKLHVSTSTLHRYCNGDAVPNEFAPVERFARVCGASGDELVEVHRRWIVADAARRRPSTGRPPHLLVRLPPFLPLFLMR
ncbi:Helix-turn-helix domain-containing protein [Streptomyces sp. Ncost-T6T-2b]|nr:Helix-turn-helix domain-containing protein [Streptomyces sp. Ncost-T6T-2b]